MLAKKLKGIDEAMKNLNGWKNLVFMLIATAIVAGSAGRLYPAERAQAASAASGQFFIISSVDLNKHQLVLKAPTEVTELAQVTDKTVYLDEDGKRLQFNDLRAGDTVYVTLVMERPNTRVITRLRKGPMTPGELHRRYLSFR